MAFNFKELNTLDIPIDVPFGHRNFFLSIKKAFNKIDTLLSKESIESNFIPRWSDLRFPAVGQQLDSTSGRLDYDFVECNVQFAYNARYPEEPLCFCAQMPHSKVLDTPIRVHVHWVQEQSVTPNWLIAYRWYANGAIIPDWTLLPINTNVYTYTSGSILQVSKFPELNPFIILGKEKLSSVLDIKLFRDSDNTSGLFSSADTYSGSASLKELDVHILYDSLGSKDERYKY